MRNTLIICVFSAPVLIFYIQIDVRAGPPFNGYLIHKLVLEKKYKALIKLLSLCVVGAEDINQLVINRKAAVDGNTALHLAVASADERLVKVSYYNQ